MDGNSIQTDPQYWWRESLDMYHDAAVLLKNGGTRKSVVNCCHGSMERALKAILAEKGLLSEADKRHSLASLLRDAGLERELDAALLAFMRHASPLHLKSTYPEDDYLPWEDVRWYASMVTNTKKFMGFALSRKDKWADGKANER